MNAGAPLSRPPSFSPGLPGRQSEWQLLGQTLTAFLDGRSVPSMILVSGEAGIGKTALVEALAVDARSSGITVLTATAYDLEVPIPYGIWQEIFQSAGQRRDLPQPPTALTDRASLEGIAGAHELWDLAARHILAIAGQQPLWLILEDLHWADQASVELLRYIVRQIVNVPVLIVATYRDIELTAAYPLYHLLPHLVRETRPTRISLPPLGPEGCKALVSQRYPTMDASDVERLKTYLERYTEGNPLFIEELIGLLEDQRALRLLSGVWRLGELPEFAVPPLIRQIIEVRLDNLSQEARRTLEIASVIGTEVPLDLWKSVPGMTGEEELDVLEEVLRTSVLEKTSAVEVLRFRHTLVRDAIYWGMNLLVRRRWHTRIGEVLANQYDADPGVVAHHFVQAGDERAVEWLIESAQRASRAFAMQSAIAGYERALTILGEYPDRLRDKVDVLCALAEAHRFTDTERALTYVHEAVDLAEQMDDPGSQALSAWVQARIHGFDGRNALRELTQAAVAFEQLPDSEQQRIATSPLGYVVSRATLAQELANYGMFKAALEQAETFLAAHSRPISRAQYIEFGNAHFGIGIACAALGQPERARSAFEASRDYFRDSSNFQMVANSCYWELSSALQVYGADQPDERHRLQREEVQANLRSEFVEAKTGERRDSTSETLILDGDWDDCWRSANLRLSIPASRIPSARKLAEIEWLRGNLEKAGEYVRTALPAGPDEPPGRRFFLHRQDLQWIAAEIALENEDVELALRWIEAFERWVEWSSRSAGRATASLLWSKYFAQRGDVDAATQHARRSLEFASAPHQPLATLRALRTLGELSLAAGKPEQALEHLEAALSIARQCGAPHELALSQVSLAAALIPSRSTEQVPALLAEAASTAERLGARPLLVRIDEMSLAPSNIPDESPLGLTPRQIEVLTLLARGMTDAEIAEALFISTRTVHGHLNTIYSKLDVDSRTGAVARAFSEGIVSV